jgi:hypothetical protein
MMGGWVPVDTLNFASYAKAIKKGMAKPKNIEVAKLLLGLIVENENVVNSDGGVYNINDNYVSLWWNQHEDIPGPIKIAAASTEIMSEATDYFEERVLTALSPQKEADTYSALLELIERDSNMSRETRNNLISLYNSNELSQFLAETFLYAVQKDNKTQQKDAVSVTPTSISIIDDVNKLNELLQHFPRPVELLPPEQLSDHEMVYISELLAAYANAEGKSRITKDELTTYPKYRKNFERQRKDYYAAETIRESARDVFGLAATDEFNVLKKETCDGIIDVHDVYYPNGFDRLNSVMKHVTTIQLNKSLLTQLPGWISSSEKKGFCHMLVNDREIKWVDDYE